MPMSNRFRAGTICWRWSTPSSPRRSACGVDEPTNDLDLETLDLLQEQLAEDPGTVLLVSHDRDFLDRVVTSTIAIDGNGRWVEYAGGYTDMLAQRAEESRGPPPPKTRNTKRSRRATQTSELPGSLPRRMNFNDRRALDLLPARIAALEAGSPS